MMGTWLIVDGDVVKGRNATSPKVAHEGKIRYTDRRKSRAFAGEGGTDESDQSDSEGFLQGIRK